MPPLDPTTFEPLRPVGLLERWSTARHELQFYTNVMQTGIYTPPASWGSPSPQQLLTAITAGVATVIAQKPTLSALPIDEAGPNPRFVRIPAITLSDVVTLHELPGDDEALHTWIERENNIDFRTAAAEGKPVWRVTVIPRPDGVAVAWAYHHCLADGGSGLALHRALLAALPAALPDAAPTIVTAPSDPLPPPQEDVLKLQFSWTTLLGELWRSWRPPVVPRVWTTRGISAPVVTRVHVLRIPAALTTQMVAAARARGTTVTALLMAVVAEVFLAEVPEARELTFGLPVSTRRWIADARIDDGSIGAWVTMFEAAVTRAALHTAGVWGAAKGARAAIEKMLAGRGRDTGVALLPYIRDWTTVFTEKLGRPASETVEISNVGVFDGAAAAGEGGTGWGVSRMVFSQSASVTGNAVEVSVASVKGGEMTLCFCVQEGLVREGLVEALCEGLVAAVERAVEAA
ncbi:alcohol acetyltransferase [Geopyxis carbonaria]|nr:alcohol acetyltransferase [Geopyxis carbonaria]